MEVTEKPVTLASEPYPFSVFRYEYIQIIVVFEQLGRSNVQTSKTCWWLVGINRKTQKLDSGTPFSPSSQKKFKTQQLDCLDSLKLNNSYSDALLEIFLC